MSNVVFTFGRMNPPTIGHSQLVSTVISTAKSTNAEHIIYLSQSCNNKTDPLPWDFKRGVCTAAFPGANISNDSAIKNPFIALEHLKDKFKIITLVAGSDQVDEYIKRFTPYAEKWGVKFDVVSAGIRNADAIGTSGVSATKMRQFANDKNLDQFLNFLPNPLTAIAGKLVFEYTKKGLAVVSVKS